MAYAVNHYVYQNIVSNPAPRPTPKKPLSVKQKEEAMARILAVAKEKAEEDARIAAEAQEKAQLVATRAERRKVTTRKAQAKYQAKQKGQLEVVVALEAGTITTDEAIHALAGVPLLAESPRRRKDRPEINKERHLRRKAQEAYVNGLTPEIVAAAEAELKLLIARVEARKARRRERDRMRGRRKMEKIREARLKEMRSQATEPGHTAATIEERPGLKCLVEFYLTMSLKSRMRYAKRIGRDLEEAALTAKMNHCREKLYARLDIEPDYLDQWYERLVENERKAKGLYMYKIQSDPALLAEYREVRRVRYHVTKDLPKEPVPEPEVITTSDRWLEVYRAAKAQVQNG